MSKAAVAEDGGELRRAASQADISGGQSRAAA